MDTPETLIARLQALIAKWRELARLARPLDSAPLTAEKRTRVAEWIHYSNRASELEAVLKAHALSGATPAMCERCNLNPSRVCVGCATVAEDLGADGVTVWPPPQAPPHGPVDERFMRHYYGSSGYVAPVSPTAPEQEK